MVLNRRCFLAGMTALLGSQDKAAAQGKAPANLLIDATQLPRLRDLAKSKHLEIVDGLAGAALKAGPWSVTYSRPTGPFVSTTEHDYFSEGTYWWPDPKNPNGPYIRKDGHHNPANFAANHDDMGKMCSAILALGMGAALLKKPGCVDRASLVLSTWFADPKTRMNPNLEFGQAIRGVSTGRGTGLIDTVPLIHAAQGISLLEAAGGLDSTVSAGVRQWYSDFANWMTTSKKGLDEKKSGNNHATWWTAQVAAYALLTGNLSMQKMSWDHYRDYLVPTEIQPDGSCPKEEARTNSLGYSSMNLDAFAVVCRLGQMNAQDLWHYRAPSGVSVEKAFHYLMPYVLEPVRWTKEQIGVYSSHPVFPGLAGIGQPSPELIAAYRKLPRDKSPWGQFVDLVVDASQSA
jgi:hypothetical protein